MHTIDERISVGGHLATVRWVGRLPAWGDVEALGVEWDDPSRGKHSGVLAGKQYFHLAPGAGLFIKATNRHIEPAVLFAEAVERRYRCEDTDNAQESLTESAPDSLAVTPKDKFSVHGLGRLAQSQRNLQALKVVMVDRQVIGRAGEFSTVPMLPAAETLDLSGNVLLDPAEVEAILEQTPLLVLLTLNGTRAGLPTIPALLVDLNVAACGLTGDLLLRHNFQSLRRLNVLGNALASVLFQWTPPPTLCHLDVSETGLTTIPGHWAALGLVQLVAARNAIGGSPQNTGIVDGSTTFLNITYLDLRHNRLTELDLDLVAAAFPNLSTLWCTHNPVLEKLSPDEAAVQLAGRFQCAPKGKHTFGKITLLNGSDLSADEIRSCELYFVSAVRAGKTSVRPERWQQLLAQHGLLDEALVAPTRPESFPTIELTFRHNTATWTHTFLLSSTVLRLIGHVARRLGVRALLVLLHEANSTTSTASESEAWPAHARLLSLHLHALQMVSIHCNSITTHSRPTSTSRRPSSATTRCPRPCSSP